MSLYWQELCELLYADDFVLISETIRVLRNKIRKWQEAFRSKGSKVDLQKTKVMISGGITKIDFLSMSKVYPCGICSWRVTDHSFLCVQCEFTVDVFGWRG